MGRPRGHCVPDSHGPPGRGPTVHEGRLGGRRCGFCWFKWEGQPLKDRESPRCQPCLTGTQPSLGRHCRTPLPNKDTTRIPRHQRQGRDAHGPSPLCTAHSLGTLGGAPGRSCPHLHSLPNPWGREPPPLAAPGMDLSQALRAHVSFRPEQAGGWVPQDAAAHTPPTTRPCPARLS